MSDDGGETDEPDALANESWFNNRWRPAMAWLWFTVSAFDFIIFPILNAAAAGAGFIPYHDWQPLTLKGGGLFHLAMGGVVGVATWSRTKEKLAIYGASGSSVMSSDTLAPAPPPKNDPDPGKQVQPSSRAD